MYKILLSHSALPLLLTIQTLPALAQVPAEPPTPQSRAWRNPSATNCDGPMV